MGYDRRALMGIGGWLAFFIITLALNALASLVQPFAVMATPGAQRLGGAWTEYLVFTWLLSATKAIGWGYAAWRLNARQDPSTPRLVIIILWTLALVPSLLDAIVGTGLLPITAEHAAQIAGSAVVRPAVYATVWTAYLLRSERVANTYTPGTAEDEALVAVFE